MIKAIETRYNGYRFRSRLEARWAVFFDALGIEYDYELDGFDIDGTWYLPDFWLPKQKYWLEIKPNTDSLDKWPSHLVFNLIDRLDSEKDWADLVYSFYLIKGNPWLDPKSYDFGYNVFISSDYNYRWCECPDCGYIGLQFDGRSDRLACKGPNGCPRHSANRDKGYNVSTPRLMRAYRAARQARFEHGETPKGPRV